ncbi:NUDIX domain-containing protein [Curtobacterium sp. NPDC087080]|uniref:NUDIX domain-containing protein n=1 Tax=Curtobacterium sp. NPDC087080 TaxID=3363965 RepID=UPI003826A0B9
MFLDDVRRRPTDRAGAWWTGGKRVRSAAVVVLDERVLVIRRVKDGRSYCVLPGGGVEEDEDLRGGPELHRASVDDRYDPTWVAASSLDGERLVPDEARRAVHLVLSADRPVPEPPR